MTAVPSVPPFSITWTEPLSMGRSRQHSLDVNLVGESGSSPLRGHVTSTTKDFLGPIPASGTMSESFAIKNEAGAAAITNLWQQIKGDRVERWLPQASESSRLDRNDFELKVTRGADRIEFFSADLKDAAQPIKDVVASAAHILADMRMHGTPPSA